VIYEKFVLAATVAALSSLLLYNYNIYSKAFEFAQTQSQGYAPLINRLRELLIEDSSKSADEVRSSYLAVEPSLDKKTAEGMFALAADIERYSSILADRAPESARTAAAVSRLTRESAFKFSTSKITRKEFDDFYGQLTRLQTDFINAASDESRELALREFRTFRERFEKEIPWYLRTEYVFGAAIAAILFWTFFVRRILKRSATGH
jgi:hypothetical protein